ncbi:MAG: SNF2-related protein [Candidatus Thorarchaeota archaeon]
MHFTPYQKQREAITFLLKHPFSGVFADPGEGKTAITLSTINILKRLRTNYSALIVAPLTVCYNVWPDEIALWDQFNEIDWCILHGKHKLEKLQEKHDLYLINPEAMKWLFQNLSRYYRKFPYYHLILDESTRFKNMRGVQNKTERCRALKIFLHRFKRRTILTGTPIPESLLDIFGQMYCIDEGKTLGKHIVIFREKYFNDRGYKHHHKWIARPEASKAIEERIAPRILRIETEHKKDPIINKVWVTLPPEIQANYDELEKKLYTTIEGEEYFTDTATSKYNALRQIASGCLYEKIDSFENTPKLFRRKTYNLHLAKFEALENLINELHGKPLLIGYYYRFIIPHLEKALKVSLPALNGDTSQSTMKKYIRQWNKSKLPLMVGQPQSIGHGLNLHKGIGRDIAWYNLPDRFEWFDQFNRRIHRSGVTARVHLILARNTIDQLLWYRLHKKGSNQQTLLDGLKGYLKERYG